MKHFPWQLINLRTELKAEIPKTTYLSHCLHNYYPAKFIPQVPRFVIRELGLTDKVILDPFAGNAPTMIAVALVNALAVARFRHHCGNG